MPITMIYQSSCKDCGAKFSFTTTADFCDAIRGFSPPERCPKCRKKNARFINSVGVAYWPAELELDPQKQVIGKFGLGRLARTRVIPKLIKYEGVPVNSPPEKFQKIAPIAEKLIQNLENPSGYRVSILVGPTGTGKSTWVPYRILRSKVGETGRICVTQPRLVTLRPKKGGDDSNTLPGFISKELLRAPGVGAGQEIGYLFRGESSQWDRYTKLLFVTDGILIRWLISGDIAQFNVVMIDEAHEQSSNMELIFALLRYKLPLYPHLRVVIASATVDVDRFTNYFGDGNPETVFVAAPDEVQLTHTPHQIYDRWPDGKDGYEELLENFRLPRKDEEIPLAITWIIQAIRTQLNFTQLGLPTGDILVFVPTIKLVDLTKRAVETLHLTNLQVLPCHAQMSNDELTEFKRSEDLAQQALIENQSGEIQRVIIATNYAETSVTISNLRYVIDSGLIMEPTWDAKTCSMQYQTKPHSQAGCTQRKGRVGRVQEGECFRLYSHKRFSDPTQFPPSPVPAISREPLDKFLLTAKAAGIDELDSFKWLGLPETPPREVTRAVKSLHKHGALDTDEDITVGGYELEQVQTATIDLAKFMADSDSFACALEVATFLSFIGLQRSPFQRGAEGLRAYAEWSLGCVDDLELYLRLYSVWTKEGAARNNKKNHRKWSQEMGLNHDAMLRVSASIENNLRQYQVKTHTDVRARSLALARLERVRYVLARCLPEWIYVTDSTYGDARLFIPKFPDKCPCNIPIGIDRDSAALVNQDLDAFLCVERGIIGSMIFARHVIRISQSTLDKLLPIKHPLLFASKLMRLNSSPILLNRKPYVEFTTAGYHQGQAISLRYIRTPEPDRFDLNSNKEGQLLLARDLERGTLVLTRLLGDMAIPPRSNFRATIETLDGDALILTQRTILSSYELGSFVDNAIIINLLQGRQNEEEIHAVIVEIEAGIEGILRKRNLLYHQGDQIMRPDSVGNCLRLRILEVSDKRIELTTEESYAALQLKLDTGTTMTATVIGFIENRSTSPYRYSGAKLQLTPKADGVVFWRNIGQNKLDNLTVGQELIVEIINPPQGKYRSYEVRAI